MRLMPPIYYLAKKMSNVFEINLPFKWWLRNFSYLLQFIDVFSDFFAYCYNNEIINSL